ncbi:ferredoxin [Prauserella endophytica]|uniref:Ferredoxin n=1 Tax=Prauserella endophytica TaxID=1592324 RepID=A0ABY2S056_9PSEU|nr:ferredoxin [Prauserella endophytica]TKG66728.1 ferredoxin [Prauserella endophytica]
MKVEVDRDLCEANAVCVGIAPGVFELDDDDELRIVRAEVPEGQVELVSQAIDACPRNALFKSR